MDKEHEKTIPALSESPAKLLIKALVFFAVWLILSGHFDAFHMGTGAVAVGIVLFINRKGLPIARETLIEGAGPRPLRIALYVPWLLWQMLLSASHVAALVLHPRLPIQPSLLRFRSDQPTVSAQVIFGQSITLTPGTLTLEIENNDFLIHTLTERSAHGLLEGPMAAKVAALYMDRPGKTVYDIRLNVEH